MILAPQAPELPASIVGVATPFREEDLAFEVAGRVASLPEIGDEVQGPVLDEEKRVVKAGDTLAELDRTRYEQAREASALSLATARKSLEAQQLEAESIVSADLDRAIAAEKSAAQLLVSAEAELTNRRSTFERVEALLQAGTANKQRFENERAALESARASAERYRQELAGARAATQSARASIKLSKLQSERSAAQVAESKQALTRVEQDLTDCKLIAPFSGRVTALHTTEGGIVQAGTRVATLTMMNPLKVTVTVNAAMSRKLVPGMQAKILPAGIEMFTQMPELRASVWGKPEVADSSTRTYRVDFVVRNIKRNFSGARDSKVASIRDIMPVIQPQLAPQEGVPLYVFADCIGEDEQGFFVHRIPGAKIGNFESIDLASVLKLERISIQKRREYLTFVDYTFVGIEDGSGLTYGQYVAMDPSAAQLEGAVISGFDWLLRPGELVPVHLDLDARTRGYYVPVEAIRHREGRHSVFVVDEQDVIRQVEVSVHESTGRTRRIEGEALSDGTRVVTKGRHYVVEGAKVRVMNAAEAR